MEVPSSVAVHYPAALIVTVPYPAFSQLCSCKILFHIFGNKMSFIVFLAKHICELDNLVQRFNQKKRVKNGGRGYVCLPSPIGLLRFDYLQSMENDPAPQEKEFPFELEIIYMEEPGSIVFDYWCTIKNTQLPVTFEYKEKHFFLRKYGAFDCIPDNWEESE